jgi:hypothetical protein
MRQLFILIVIAAIGYLAYTFSKERFAKPLTDEGEEGAPPSTVQPVIPPIAPVAPVAPATPAAPVFKSRIADRASGTSSGEKRLAPLGTLYMVERVSVETKNGIIAVVPGDEVKVLKRTGDRLKVTIGKVDFEVKEIQVTNDLDVAQAAEKKEFARRIRPR